MKNYQLNQSHIMFICFDSFVYTFNEWPFVLYIVTPVIPIHLFLVHVISIEILGMILRNGILITC